VVGAQGVVRDDLWFMFNGANTKDPT